VRARPHLRLAASPHACRPLGAARVATRRARESAPILAVPLRYDEGDSGEAEEVADAGCLKVHERVYARATGAATEVATLVGARGLQVYRSAGWSLSPRPCTHHLVIGACRMAVGSVICLSGATTPCGDRVKGHRLLGTYATEIRRPAWRMLRSPWCPVVTGLTAVEPSRGPRLRGTVSPYGERSRRLEADRGRLCEIAAK